MGRTDCKGECCPRDWSAAAGELEGEKGGGREDAEPCPASPSQVTAGSCFSFCVNSHRRGLWSFMLFPAPPSTIR